jgi:hypothetical protein
MEQPSRDRDPHDRLGGVSRYGRRRSRDHEAHSRACRRPDRSRRQPIHSASLPGLRVSALWHRDVVRAGASPTARSEGSKTLELEGAAQIGPRRTVGLSRARRALRRLARPEDRAGAGAEHCIDAADRQRQHDCAGAKHRFAHLLSGMPHRTHGSAQSRKGRQASRLLPALGCCRSSTPGRLLGGFESGFRAKWTEAIQILPSTRGASIPTNLRFQMLDSDAAYLQTLG